MRHAGSIATLVLCVALIAGGCAKTPPRAVRFGPPEIGAGSGAPPAPPPPPAASDSGPAASLTEDELFAAKSLEQLNAERPLGDVWFDVDQSTLRADARAALQRNAEWLRRWASTRITIEGHCDERGTSEYNLALGARRGATVRDYLVNLGIAPERLTVVSKGKESPACVESSEDCWQQNRRAHSIITAR